MIGLLHLIINIVLKYCTLIFRKHSMLFQFRSYYINLNSMESREYYSGAARINSNC